MKKRCRNCKHWELTEDLTDCPVRRCLGECSATPHVDEASDWTADFSRMVEAKEHKKTTAFAADSSGYYAGLLTKPKHYCSMWEEK